MVRKLKISAISKEEKAKKEHFERVYANVLKTSKKGAKKHSKENLKKIYTCIEDVEAKKFKYLSFAYVLATSDLIEDYLEMDVAFGPKIKALFDDVLNTTKAYMNKVMDGLIADAFKNGVVDTAVYDFTNWAKTQLKNGSRKVYMTEYYNPEYSFEIKNLYKYDAVFDVITNAKDYLIFKNSNKAKKRKKRFKFNIEKETDRMVQVELQSPNQEVKFVYMRDVDYAFLYDGTVVNQIFAMLHTVIAGEEGTKKELESITNKFQTLLDFLYFNEVMSGLTNVDIKNMMEINEKVA